jgi:hypothetical protein
MGQSAYNHNPWGKEQNIAHSNEAIEKSPSRPNYTSSPIATPQANLAEPYKDDQNLSALMQEMERLKLRITNKQACKVPQATHDESSNNSIDNSFATPEHSPLKMPNAQGRQLIKNNLLNLILSQNCTSTNESSNANMTSLMEIARVDTNDKGALLNVSSVATIDTSTINHINHQVDTSNHLQLNAHSNSSSGAQQQPPTDTHRPSSTILSSKSVQNASKPKVNNGKANQENLESKLTPNDHRSSSRNSKHPSTNASSHAASNTNKQSKTNDPHQSSSNAIRTSNAQQQSSSSTKQQSASNAQQQQQQSTKNAHQQQPPSNLIRQPTFAPQLQSMTNAQQQQHSTTIAHQQQPPNNLLHQPTSDVQQQSSTPNHIQPPLAQQLTTGPNNQQLLISNDTRPSYSEALITGSNSNKENRKRYRVVLETKKELLNVFKDKIALYNELTRQKTLGAFTIYQRNLTEIVVEVIDAKDVETLLSPWDNASFGSGIKEAYLVSANNPELMILARSRDELDQNQLDMVKQCLQVQRINKKSNNIYDFIFGSNEARDKALAHNTYNVLGTIVFVEPWTKKVFVLQCFNCQRYKHKDDKCRKKPMKTCRYCGLEYDSEKRSHPPQQCHNISRQFFCINCKCYGHEAGAREGCPTFLKEYNLACEKQQVVPNDRINNTIIEYQNVETMTINTLLLLKMMIGDPNFNKLDFTRTASKFLPKSTIDKYVNAKEDSLKSNSSTRTQSQSETISQSSNQIQIEKTILPNHGNVTTAAGNADSNAANLIIDESDTQESDDGENDQSEECETSKNLSEMDTSTNHQNDATSDASLSQNNVNNETTTTKKPNTSSSSSERDPTSQIPVSTWNEKEDNDIRHNLSILDDETVIRTFGQSREIILNSLDSVRDNYFNLMKNDKKRKERSEGSNEEDLPNNENTKKNPNHQQI